MQSQLYLHQPSADNEEQFQKKVETNQPVLAEGSQQR
jgi:hypothetical protein